MATANTTIATAMPAVQDLKPLSKPVEDTLTNLAAIISATPPHVVLSQETALRVDAGAHNMIQNCCDDKFVKHGEISKVLFGNWAWNFTIHGDLKDEPSLTWLEREKWHELKAEKSIVDKDIAETPKEDVEKSQRRKKRVRIEEGSDDEATSLTEPEALKNKVTQLEVQLLKVIFNQMQNDDVKLT